MTCSIIGLGTAQAPEVVSQDEALALSSEVICETEKQKRLLRTLFKKSGVSSRRTVIPYELGYQWHKSDGEANLEGGGGDGPTTAQRMALYKQHATPLALGSATAAIHDAAVLPGDITHLVTVSCTGFAAPGVDIDLIRLLGLPRTVQRVHVGYMGCHGAINGMRTVQGLTAADPNACVLMCCVELCSLHFRMRWDLDGIVGNALFADGAGSLVVAGENWEAKHPHSDSICKIEATGACLIEDTTEEMSWHIGDNGFQMRLTSGVPDCIQTYLRAWITTWLGSHGLKLDDIQRWIVHPGGPRILDAVQEALQLQPNQTQISRAVLNDLGNMSSATVLFVMERNQAQTQRFEGPAVVLAFGPGVMAEAALLRY
ncbi:Alpha-pyrone synthesis polyketide synthase-like Pks18 [Rosistilla carotiformis]|uniref:Alpha-pyrone synthesis polyketide synthase-like Pks18 n=1 Tax=Rosistilla carotiformis TaxID=2528017 RepID=A0A518JQ02_9BACT|nr:type III polyketide synthase [Rosistilla carotiformis]QDV67625.1 Alpha-pyrone synthesis polyketide synthase-like Pks18 [Rosistilla carotiformis]